MPAGIVAMDPADAIQAYCMANSVLRESLSLL